MFNKLCIIGAGLIGGSVARAARANNLCTEISAYGREQDSENLARAKALNVVDSYSFDLAEAVSNADCIIIATPVGAMPEIFQRLKPCWSNDALYMDAGSTKGNVVAALQEVFDAVPSNFIPAHPIAGAENSGVEAALENLFQNRRLILTPTEQANPHFLQLAQNFWQAMGSDVSLMAVEQHDAVLAATSHLPHILAFSLVNLLGKKDETVDIFKYAAGGFKDFTRIASSDPTMWLDICMANKKQIVPLINELCVELQDLNKMLEKNDTEQLYGTFTYARNARQRFLDQYQKL